MKNVLFEEVWVFSGQSNMAKEVEQNLNSEQEMSLADYSQIRHFQIKHYKLSQAMEDRIKGNNPNSWLNKWGICSPYKNRASRNNTCSY